MRIQWKAPLFTHAPTPNTHSMEVDSLPATIVVKGFQECIEHARYITIVRGYNRRGNWAIVKQRKQPILNILQSPWINS